MRTIYAVLCFAGVALPLAQFVPWVSAHGLDMRLFLSDLFVNRISAFFGMDVIVSAIVLIVFIRAESRRLSMAGRWMPVAATLLVGVSFGLPLFLYLREAALAKRG
ncbi:MAG: DUF2834 domain-containing protein [Bryobacteraceae bacterium]